MFDKAYASWWAVVEYLERNSSFTFVIIYTRVLIIQGLVKFSQKTLFYLICFKESGIFSIVFLSIVRISLNKSLILLVRDILILQWNICQQLILPLMRIWPIPDYFVHEFLFNDQREVDRSRGHMSLFTNTRQSCIVNVIF